MTLSPNARHLAENLVKLTGCSQSTAEQLAVESLGEPNPDRFDRTVKAFQDLGLPADAAKTAAIGRNHTGETAARESYNTPARHASGRNLRPVTESTDRPDPAKQALESLDRVAKDITERVTEAITSSRGTAR